MMCPALKIHKYLNVLLVLLVISLFSACTNNDDSNLTPFDTGKSSDGFAIPAAIRAADLPADGTLEASIYMDGALKETRDVTGATSVRFELRNIPVGQHDFSIRFNFEDTTYGTVELAYSIEKSVNVTSGGTHDLNFIDENEQNTDFTFPDSDGDSIRNLVELENGTDPSEKLAIVFVSIDDSNASDDNDGTKDLPFATINAAIRHLVNQGSEAIPGEVRVAQGTYTVNYLVQNHIQLVEGISLYGGYSLDWNTRDTNTNSTIIQDTSTVGGVTDNPTRALEATGGISNSTVVDGFTIQGGSGVLSAAVFINSASPTISNNQINGGSASERSRGIAAINNSAPIIRGNAITAGSAPNAIAIVNRTGSSALIEYNTIRGGTNSQPSSYSIGILNSIASSATVIRNNDISGGLNADYSNGIIGGDSIGEIYNNVIRGNEESGGSSSYGINVSGGTSGFIANNTISSGKGSVTEVAVWLSSGGVPAIENNILLTPKSGQADTYCVLEDNSDSDPSSLRNNDFFGCATLYSDEGSNNITDIANVNSLADTTSSGNIHADPAVVNMESGNFQLSAYSGAVSAGGLDLSANFTIDKDGNDRVAPWSIGAYISSSQLPEMVIIDFDGVTPNDFPVFSEDSMTLTPVLNDEVAANGAVRINDTFSAGDNIAFPNFGFDNQDIILKRENGLPFSLSSIDVIEATAIDPPGSATLIITGIKQDSTIVSRNLNTDGIAGFQTFPLYGLSDLISVRLGAGASTEITAVDDLVISFVGGATLPNKVAFVTSVTGTGDLSSWADAGGATGVDAADAICQARAAAAALANPSTFRAWISDENNDAYCRLHNLNGVKGDNCGQATLPAAAGPWMRTDGFPFAPTIDRLVLGEVYTPMRYNEFGELVAPLDVDHYYYSATSPDGSLHASNPIPCDNWGSALSTLSVYFGSKEGTTILWSSSRWENCASMDSLLCFETGQGPDLPPFQTSGKTTFITSVSGSGNLSTWPDSQSQTGLAAGDAICQTRASVAGLPNPSTYKAWLSGLGQNAIDRLTSNGPWVRPDGVVIAYTKADLSDGSLFTAVTQDENQDYRGLNYVWTGTSSDGLETVDTCNGWTDGASTIRGVMGTSSFASPDWSDWGLTWSCDSTSHHLYCFED